MTGRRAGSAASHTALAAPRQPTISERNRLGARLETLVERDEVGDELLLREELVVVVVELGHHAAPLDLDERLDDLRRRLDLREAAWICT